MAQSGNNPPTFIAEARGNIIYQLREYVEMLADDEEWDRQFEQSRDQLIAAARRARPVIANGLAEPMNFDLL